jgi:hypothetical protein
MRQEIEERPLSKEIGRVPHEKRYWVFWIILVGELLSGKSPGASLGSSLGVLLFSYLGSLLVEERNRGRALISIALALYFLMTISFKR